MSDYRGVTWRVNYGEISEREQFRVGYVGMETYDAYFEVSQLSDLIAVLNAVVGLGLGQVSRGGTLQAVKVSDGAAVFVSISLRLDTGTPTEKMRLRFTDLTDFVYALTLFQTALSGGLRPDDWDADRPGTVLEASLPERLSQQNIESTIAGVGRVSKARASAGVTRRAPEKLGAIKAVAASMNRVLGIHPDGVSKVVTKGSFDQGVIGSTVDGSSFTWGSNFTGGNVETTAFVMTPRGEAIVSIKTRDNTSPGTLRRSTGFNPTTMNATSWATVLTAQSTAANFDGRWGCTQRSWAPLDSPGAGAGYFAEYNGNFVYETLDDGVTFAAIFDLQQWIPGAEHVHAVAYDPWDDRVWVTVGDTANAAIYYVNREDIDGLDTTWVVVPGSAGASTWQATTVIPLARGVVFLSDSPTSRVFRLPRAGERSYRPLAQSVLLTGAGLIGAHAYQVADDQPCYLTFYGPVSGTGHVPQILATIDGETFSTVHTDANATTSSGAPGIFSVAGPDANGEVWFLRNLSGSGLLARASTSRRRIRHASASRTSGNITLNSTSYVDIDTGLDLVLTAAAGDILDVGLAVSVSGGSTYAVFDFVTVVSSSPVNSVTSGGAAPAAGSFPLWAHGSLPTTKAKMGGRRKYTVQASDVATDGTVTLRLRGKSGASVTVEANGDPVLYVDAANFGQ